MSLHGDLPLIGTRPFEQVATRRRHGVGIVQQQHDLQLGARCELSRERRIVNAGACVRDQAQVLPEGLNNLFKPTRLTAIRSTQSHADEKQYRIRKTATGFGRRGGLELAKLCIEPGEVIA